MHEYLGLDADLLARIRAGSAPAKAG
jgi:hypothetical protein